MVQRIFLAARRWSGFGCSCRGIIRDLLCHERRERGEQQERDEEKRRGGMTGVRGEKEERGERQRRMG